MFTSSLSKLVFTGKAVLFLACGQAAAQDIHSDLRKGDQAYSRDQYKVAEQHYRNAADRKYGDPQALYNLGNALYQQGNWADAAQRFEQAAAAETRVPARADALHNLGNSLMKLHKFKEAVAAYQGSLRLRPGDEQTKINLQMAKKKQKEDEAREKQKQQQQQQQNNQQNNQNQQQQNNQDQPSPNDPQNQPPVNRKNENPGQPEEEEQQNGQPRQQPPAQQQQLRKEEAKKLLETAIGNEDRKNARKYRTAQQRKPKGTKKDW